MPDTSLLPDGDELAAPPRRIIFHWSGGGWEPTLEDRRHYHMLIGWDAEQEDVHWYRGVPLQNNCRQLSGDDPTFSEEHPEGYAAHTRHFNSFSMGIALCGMRGATQHPFEPGPSPIRAPQVEALIEAAAAAGHLYGLAASPDRMFTHWEADAVHNVTQRGKWDITVLPDSSGGWRDLPPRKVGSWLRRRIDERMGDYR